MKEDQIQIIFTGDLCCHNRFAQKLENGGEIISDRLKNLLAEADAVIFNYEGSSFGDKPLQNSHSKLKNSLSLAPYLKTFCKPVFNLANNHTMDYREEGLKQTIDFFRKIGLPCFGAGDSFREAAMPFVISKKDFRVNVWGVHAYASHVAGVATFGLNGLVGLEYIRNEIKGSQGIHKNILCIHGGEEFTFYPMPAKRELLKKIALDIKPDFIICHHSHSIQGTENFGDTTVFYSLGNFMFDYPSHAIYDETDKGLVVNLIFTKDKLRCLLSAVSCNAEEAMVDNFNLQDIHEISKRLGLKDYKQSIGADAYRVVFESKKNRHKIEHQTINGELKPGFHKLRLLKSILSDRFLRSLYFQAVKYKVLKYVYK